MFKKIIAWFKKHKSKVNWDAIRDERDNHIADAAVMGSIDTDGLNRLV